MLKLITMMQTLKSNDEGATAIEYGLIAALIAVALIAALTTFGEALAGVFTGIETTLEGVDTTGG